MKAGLLLIFCYFFKTPYGAATAFFNDEHELGMKSPAIFADTLPRKIDRVYVVAGVHAAGYAGTLAVLSSAWYKGYEKTGFHVFNDAGEWLQLDKAGHSWTAYNIANVSTQLWSWSGLNARKAALLGGFSALGFQTILEFLDAHSAKWGWSWADMGANTFGAALFTSQQIIWNEQRVLLKFSSFPQRYDASLRPRVNELFGKTFAERLLKDYNAQTYWASFNIKSIVGAHVPPWLNLAVGYGGQGMYGGFKNIAVDKNGLIVFDRTDIKRMRQWYLSTDIDWTKIHSNRKGVRIVLSLINLIRLPAPALELRSGKLKGRWVAF